MTAVLGLKLGPQHDTGACLVWEEGSTLRCCALSEERLSRVKQDRAFPQRSIDAVLDEAGIGLGGVDLVCVDKLGPHTMTADTRLASDVDPGLWKPAETAFFAALEGTPVHIVNHHLAHAATACHPFHLDEAAVLVVDGSGTDWPGDDSADRLIDMGGRDETGNCPLRFRERRAETQSIFRCRAGRLERLAVSTRSGVGHFYSYVSKHLVGFGHLQEGKLMGLAGWGDEARLGEFPSFPGAVFDGIDTPLLEYLMKIEWPIPDARPSGIDATESPWCHLGFWAQHWLERAIVHLAREAVMKAGCRSLGAAGGVMLNVVANRLARDTLMDEGLLDDMVVQPASSDAGMPLGAALVGYHHLLGGTARFQENAVYLGPRPDETEAESFLLEHGATRPDDLSNAVADLLLSNRIIGWWQGPSEYGPRALGSRSILVWPRDPSMKDTVNARVKHRESFRPFAPICRDEDAAEIFGIDFPVPYMLFNTTVRPEFRDRIPAVTHVDGSGRLQTVSPRFTPRLHALLTEIRHRDGVGVLMNTSFNDAGEPIVESARDALDCMSRTGLDALVVGGVVLVR